MDEPPTPEPPDDEIRALNQEVRDRLPARHENLLARIEQAIKQLARENPQIIGWELPDLKQDRPVIRLRVESGIDRDLIPDDIHGIPVVVTYLHSTKPSLRLVRDKYDSDHPVFYESPPDAG